MDLKSILSEDGPPRPSPSSQPATPALQPQVPHKFVQRTHSGPILTSVVPRNPTSPLSQSMVPPHLPAHVLSPHAQPLSSPLISPVPAPTSGSAPFLTRTPSATSMDTLADLASMQNHQPSRPSPYKGTSADSVATTDSLRRSAIAQSSIRSHPRGSIDINMMETPKQATRTDFSGTSLPEEQQARLCQLTTHLAENPSAYDSHVEVVNILHNGLTEYIYPVDSPESRRDPRRYDLLDDLRMARENMAKLFAVGESLWSDWLRDESMLAQTAEERISVVEMCRKAVDEEFGSVRLWSIYTDWIQHCFNWANDSGAASHTDEERLVGKEIFTKQLVMDTFQSGLDHTRTDLSQSHVIWNKYLDFRIPNFRDKLPHDQANLCAQLFEQRLLTPHAKWDETFQAFSSFVSANLPADQYEVVMADTSRQCSKAKKEYSSREEYENAIEQSQNDSDRDAEYAAFSRYLEWERSPKRNRKPDDELINAIFQRGELRFPTDTTLWEEHVMFLIEGKHPQVLSVLDRAAKHCPWSGSLWSLYLLTSDSRGQSFQETEGIKHKATNTGILEAAGVEEVLKVHTAWCSYLRRRAFRHDRDEDDADIAEIGIRASLESLNSLGAKLGLGEVPDPSFRLQRIYVTFLSESGRWDNARAEFDNAVRNYGKSWEFWMRFYNWEMMRWRHIASLKYNEAEPIDHASHPNLAGSVLQKALDQTDLDYPEPIIQALISHCEDYEDAEDLQKAMIKAHKVQKELSVRRAEEGAAVTEGVIREEESAVQTQALDFSFQGAKRKRENSVDEFEINKKSRSDEVAVDSIEHTEAYHPKRDREHATILVENLPNAVSETELRRYFSQCGTVKAIKMLENDNGATIEFDDDAAARFALSRDGREFEGAILSITIDTGSTVFMTNYPPAADEAFMEGILGKYGEIISMRFPSLQANKNRRFCYVQFKLPADAQAAVDDLDGKDIDGLQLVCKISNPAVKQQRSEHHVNDGHTVFVGRLNFKASEKDVESAFSAYGQIELIRMPLHETMKNRNKGIAFVTFRRIAEAEAALEMNDKPIRGRPIKVEIATDRTNEKRTSKINGQEKSMTPLGLNGDASTRSYSPRQTSITSAVHENGTQPDGADRRQRTVFIIGLPDTFNEARLRVIASKYGDVVKCILRTNHQGAMIEFSTVAQAGEASLRLEGIEIEPGKAIRVVTKDEMQQQGSEKKTDGFVSRPKPKAGMVPPSGIIKRPTQPGIKPRKGGNLGQKSATLNSDSRHQPQTQVDGHATDTTSTKKTNDDFRALMHSEEGAKEK